MVQQEGGSPEMGSDRKTVRLDRVASRTALITLNRPKVRNCINRQVVEELSRALIETESDPDIRIVILTGEGNAFCAGADLQEVMSGGIFDLFTRQGGFAGFTHAVRTKPWIAAVNGPAVAGGCEIALACDMIIASNEAIFSLPEPKRGLIAGAGGIYRLSRVLPPKLATELVLTGKSISAARAAELGMINYVVPADQVRERAISLADEILASSPRAVELSLGVLNSVLEDFEPKLQQCSERNLSMLMSTGDFQEGVASFFEKRLPIWVAQAE